MKDDISLDLPWRGFLLGWAAVGREYGRSDGALRFKIESAGGLADLCQGAIHKYAPTTRWPSEEARQALIQSRVAEGRKFFPQLQLSERDLALETTEALAVWHPRALRHLLQLDAAPLIEVAVAREDFADADLKRRVWKRIVDELGPIASLLAGGSWWDSSTERNVDLESLFLSDRFERLGSSEADLRALAPAITKVCSIAKRELSSVEFFEVRPCKEELAEAERAKDAGERSQEQSLRVNRRLLTLWDGLRLGYGKWSAGKLANLILSSATDWTEPPCPELVGNARLAEENSRHRNRIVEWVKKREQRERSRRRQLGLPEQQRFQTGT